MDQLRLILNQDIEDKNMNWRIRGFLITFFLCFVSMNVIYAQTSEQGIAQAELTQDKHLNNLPDSRILLSEALERLEEEYNISFMYKTGLLLHVTSLLTEVSVSPEDLNYDNLRLALKKLLEPYNLKYTRLNNRTFVISFDLAKYATRKKQKMQEQIQGIVTDAQTGETLPGVNVMVKGTTTGASTDGDGNFEMRVESLQDTLIFSFVGYQTREVPINGRREIDIALQPQAIAGEEVVVVGYGTQRRSDLTGSVSSVSSEDIGEVAVTSFDQALQGRVAGMDVKQGSSAPGGGVEIRIRGNNSILGDNRPLFVIDGIPVNNENLTASGAGTQNISAASQNPLTNINPDNIKSIEVLKDASATAIYGSRASNGVVLVTTKQGQSGDAQLDYNGYFGFQAVTNTYDLLSGEEYARLVNEARINDGETELFVSGDAQFPGPEDIGIGTDWQDKLFQTAPTQSHNLSVSGGNENTTYYVSGNFYSQEGIVIGSQFQRGGLRTNIDSDVTENLEVGANISITRSVNDLSKSGSGTLERSNGTIAGALLFPPSIEVRAEDGFYALNNIPNGIDAGNPISVARDIIQDQTSDQIVGNIYAEYNLSRHFSLKSTLGTEIYDSKRSMYAPSTTLFGSFYNGIANQTSIRNFSWVNENTLTYNQRFLDSHDIEAVVGFTEQQLVGNRLQATSNDFPSDAFGTDALQLGSQPVAPASNKIGWSLLSGLARVHYSYQDRYLLTLAARADGSSKFGSENRWALFPSASIGWRLTEEKFMDDIDWLDNLKLRTSYGISGSSGSPYQALARLQSVFYILNDQIKQGFTPAGVPNPELKWETTSSLNIGVDAGFLGSRLELTADYYYKKTKDLLLDIPIATTSGFSNSLQNAGTLENRGFELGISAVPANKRLSWRINGNISFNRNKVLDLAGRDQFFIGGTLVKEGEPLGQWYRLEYDGVYQTQQQLENGPEDAGAEVGFARYVDQNGDGVVNSDDRVIVGNPTPDFIYGLTNNFSFKGFDLRIFVQGVYGSEVLNETRGALSNLNMATNQIASIAEERWTPDHSNTNVPKATFGQNGTNPSSSRLIEDGSYLRLKNITLGYQVPLAGNTVRRLRLYLSAENAITITGYSGFSPDVDATSGGGVVSNVDRFSYPTARTVSLGVNIGF